MGTCLRRKHEAMARAALVSMPPGVGPLGPAAWIGPNGLVGGPAMGLIPPTMMGMVPGMMAGMSGIPQNSLGMHANGLPGGLTSCNGSLGVASPVCPQSLMPGMMHDANPSVLDNSKERSSSSSLSSSSDSSKKAKSSAAQNLFFPTPWKQTSIDWDEL